MVSLGNTNGFEKLLSQLRTSDVEKICEAADKLGLSGDKRAVGPLIQLLNGADAMRVKNSAAWNLGQLGAQEALPHLVRHIQNPSLIGLHGGMLLAACNLDCRSILDVIAHVAAHDTFECFMHSCSILSDMSGPIEKDVGNRALIILRNFQENTPPVEMFECQEELAYRIEKVALMINKIEDLMLFEG